jgi:1,4-dihydroxy-2-naphthoyl-CoA synthase
MRKGVTPRVKVVKRIRENSEKKETKLTEKLEYTDIIVEKKYPIGHITINHPEKRNALVGGTIP